jgi:hypothetical protein
MANEYWVSPSIDGTTACDTATGMPGAAPVPGAGNQMQGNPDPRNINQPQVLQTPAPQNPVQQLSSTQMSSGLIATNSVPTNANTAPGTDSLLAQMSRGQVLMCDSTYGQSGFIPQNGGASPQAVSPAANITQPVTARVASVLTYPTSSPTNHTGT